MAYVLSIIADPAAPIINADVKSRFNALTPGDGWLDLSPSIASELSLQEADQTLLSSLRDAAKDLPLDINILPAEHRRKRLLIADMDSTIIEQECIDELAEFAGKRAEISAITERAMRGELNFEQALEERVAMLKGLSLSVLAQTFEKSISLMPGARTLIQTMRENGAYTMLVSGGFNYFAERVAEATGFQMTQANLLLAENDHLTGAVSKPILGRSAKQEALERVASEKSIDLKDTLAVGDGANDLSMLGKAGLGVAFHAKPAVAEAADVRIDHGDLTALLYLQGYAQADFITE